MAANDHVFRVDLTGLKLSKERLQRINIAIQTAVLQELGSEDSAGEFTDLAPLKGGLVSIFPPHYPCGIIGPDEFLKLVEAE